MREKEKSVIKLNKTGIVAICMIGILTLVVYALPKATHKAPHLGRSAQHAKSKATAVKRHAVPRPTATPKVLTGAATFNCFIDGSDYLHIKGNTVWYIHRSWNLPGKFYPKKEEPTRINEKDWFPTWDGNTSSKYTTLSPPLPISGVIKPSIEILRAGGDITLQQAPEAANGYEAVIFLDDDSNLGPHWYNFRLHWTAVPGKSASIAKAAPLAKPTPAAIVAPLTMPTTRPPTPVATATPASPPVVSSLQPVTDRVVVNLPGPIEDVVAGGNGRYLILWLKNVQKLAIFDALAQRVIRYLPVPAEDVKFAADADKLIVVLNDQSIMQRWNLQSGERELTVPAPEGGPVHSMVMGYASRGPLMIVNGAITLLDPATFKKIDANMQFAVSFHWNSDLHNPLLLRASGDGTTFGAWHGSGSPNVIEALRVDGQATSYQAATSDLGYFTPNFDGSLFFGPQVFAASGLRVIAPDRFKGSFTVPVYGGHYFVALRGTDNFRFSQGGKLTAALYQEDGLRLILTLTDLDEMTFDRGQRSGLTFDKRLHIFPDAQLMVTIPDSKDKLILRRFNLIDELDKVGIDYLFVTSRPTPSARRGQVYTYQITAEAKRGMAQYVLDSGPPGMTLSKTGKLEWPVPADYNGKEENIIITLRDAAGQEIFHTFKIAVQ
jgi:hypothetical protein